MKMTVIEVIKSNISRSYELCIIVYVHCIGVALQRNKDSNEYMKQKPGMMTLEEFKLIISGMLGTTKWNDQMEMLFYKVSTFKPISWFFNTS